MPPPWTMHKRVPIKLYPKPPYPNPHVIAVSEKYYKTNDPDKHIYKVHAIDGFRVTLHLMNFENGKVKITSFHVSVEDIKRHYTKHDDAQKGVHLSEDLYKFKKAHQTIKSNSTTALASNTESNIKGKYDPNKIVKKLHDVNELVNIVYQADFDNPQFTKFLTGPPWVNENAPETVPDARYCFIIPIIVRAIQHMEVVEKCMACMGCVECGHVQHTCKDELCTLCATCKSHPLESYCKECGECLKCSLMSCNQCKDVKVSTKHHYRELLKTLHEIYGTSPFLTWAPLRALGEEANLKKLDFMADLLKLPTTQRGQTRCTHWPYSEVGHWAECYRPPFPNCYFKDPEKKKDKKRPSKANIARYKYFREKLEQEGCSRGEKKLKGKQTK